MCRRSKHRMLSIGDVVRIDFRPAEGTSPAIVALHSSDPPKVYGSVGRYGVALYSDDHAGMYRMVKLKLMRSDIDEAYPLAVLPASREGHFEAHAIAAAV
jgi:hypothetical protein